MDRSIPVFNRVVVNRLQKNHFDLHMKRLDDIRHNSNKKQWASTPKSNVLNLKKMQIQQQKRTQIQRQNIILFNKMNRILNRSTEINQKLNITQTISRDKDLPENIKIYQQNIDILQRIGNQKPTISNRKLMQDRVKQQRLLKFMCKYPYKLKPLSFYNSTQSSPDKSEESKKKTDTIINLFKKRKEINGIIFKVVINRINNQFEFKVIQIGSLIEYSLVLSEQQGNQIFSRFHYDYDQISNKMSIVDNKLVLDASGKHQKKPKLAKLKRITDDKQVNHSLRAYTQNLRHNIVYQQQLSNELPEY